MEAKKRRGRGLSAIADAREDRAQGRARWTTQAGLAAGAAILAGLVAHKVVTGRELRHDKQELLSKQRAVDATLGAEWDPLRDTLENAILVGSKDYAGDFVDPDARRSDFRTQPGLYLRMRVTDAKSAEAVRKFALDAKKDAFAGCLLREPNERGVRGEIDGGAFAEQPWNLGQAYAATRVLTGDWVREVAETDDPLRFRAFDEQFQKAVRTEIPLSVDVVKRAKFFLLVLDEDVPEAARLADGGAITESALQLVAHPARVHLFALPSGKLLTRLRRSREALVVSAGERMVTDSETRDAMQRQANNCALARSVDEALAPTATASAADGGR